MIQRFNDSKIQDLPAACLAVRQDRRKAGLRIGLTLRNQFKTLK